MLPKESVLLTVIVETAELRWFVAGIGLAGEALPLMRSEEGNLGAYIGEPFDEQVGFLRHRLSGALQRGCDRLWGRQMKACQIVFVTDGPFAQASPDLTRRVAEHFVEWMTRPPVVFFTGTGVSLRGTTLPLEKIAGDLSQEHLAALDRGLPELVIALDDADAWELAVWKARYPAQSDEGK